MFCQYCGKSVQENDNFCANCGKAIQSLSSSDEEIGATEGDIDRDCDFDEENVIRYYFKCGFSYEEIIVFLAKRHNIQMSYRTFLRRLKIYGLSRRGFFTKNESEEDFERARECIREMIDGPASSGGYRTLWHSLEMEGVRIPRVVVQDLLKELDPEGVQERKTHRLKTRVYHNPGPNYAWHIDGYDKLKPWGFPIHGAVDGFSRKILWLYVTRSNNSPDNIANFYLNTVKQFKGCPVDLVTDLGTENAIVAGAQCYFRDNPDSHRYVPSPRNQRIEGWWSFYCKSRSNWWRSFFQDLDSQHVVDTTSELSMECLWYCFSDVIQDDLDAVREQWNTHRIRQSRHNTVAGRPDSLFYLPEHHGAQPNLLHVVTEDDIDCVQASLNVGQIDVNNEYHEYFDYVTEVLQISPPKTWQEAYQLYCKLVFLSENGGC